MTDWDRAKRIFGEIAFNCLKDKTVAVVGCGSGGSYAALNLAEAGVGGFILIDKENLKEENIIRHVGGKKNIGYPKVSAVFEAILRFNEDFSCSLICDDAKNRINQIMDADLILVCVDNEPIKHIINEEARKAGKTVIYAGVYEKGEGGEICVVYPNSGPCYACIASQLRFTGKEKDEEKQNDNLDYGAYDNEGRMQGEPGLSMHIKRIASFQADFALRELLRGAESTLKPFPSQVLIFNNEERQVFEDKPAHKPCTGIWIQIPKNPNCLICSLNNFKTGDTKLENLLDS